MNSSPLPSWIGSDLNLLVSIKSAHYTSNLHIEPQLFEFYWIKSEVVPELVLE